MIVDLWAEPVAGEPWILPKLPAPLCAEHEQEHRSLGVDGRRAFARSRGIQLGRHPLERAE